MGVVTVRYHCGKKKKEHSVLNHLGQDLLSAVKDNRAMVLLALLFLAGMVGGTFYSRSTQLCTLSRLDFLFAGNFKARLTQPLVTVFAASFASAFLFVLVCFLFGLSMWGAFCIPVVPIFRGFGLGLTAGYLYSVYGGKGILFYFAVILPGAFLCCFSILAAALEGICYSRALASHRMSQTGEGFRTYMLHFGLALALACASAGLDTLLTAVFGGCFSF